LPLSADDFVQENSGTVTTAGTSCVVSLPSGTTAGNTVVVLLTSTVGVTAPSGFVNDKVASVNLYVYRKSEVAASETSWTFTTASDSTFSWYAAELAGVDPVEPLESSAVTSTQLTGNGGTLSTGTAPQNAALETVVLAAFAVGGGHTSSWSGYTNGLEEVLDSGSGQEITYQLAVARKFVTGVTGQFETTATLATSSGSALVAHALLVTYRAAGSPIVAPLAMFAGMEWGTHGGINSHTGATSMLGNTLAHSGTWGTNYLIQAASARNSDYGLQIVQSAAGAAVRMGGVSSGSASVGLDVRVVSATSTVTVAQITTAAGSAVARLRYDASTSKFGVQCGTTGTMAWQSGTTATNTWAWVDFRLKVNTTTWHLEWSIEEAGVATPQTSPADLTGQTATTVGGMTLGTATAQTMTADYDNICLSAYWVAYPLGPHQVRLLTVDTGGTPTVSGTSSNFSVFTANGTLGAWNATNARNAVDEVPPTVSASADGVCQTAVAASDYMEFPMAAATLADDEVIDGVRMLAPAWGGTGTGTGTLGIRGWNGTTETTLIPASTSYDAGSPTAVSSTEPRWQCAMWPFPGGGWTKTRLDATSLRVGFSTDATPDMGVDALYLEYATKKAEPEYVFGGTGELRVEQDTDPNTGGIRALRAYTPAGQTATLVYELDGVAQTPVVISAASNPQVILIDAPDLPTVSRIELVPDEPS
jgi:hypothetical protein